MRQRGSGVRREAHGPWRLPRRGERILTLGGAWPATSPPFPHIPPTADPPEGHFLMPVLAPGEKEIVLAKPPLDPLAQGMAELAAEASGVPVPWREGVRQLLREDIPQGTPVVHKVLRQVGHTPRV